MGNPLDKPYLSISEFADVVKISRKALIYYDKMGVLAPCLTTKNGYRFYSPDQVDIADAIKVLAEIGVPLKDIKEYLVETRSADGIQDLLLHQKGILEDRIEHLKFILEMIDSKLSSLEEAKAAENFLSVINDNDETFTTIDIIQKEAVQPIYEIPCEVLKRDPGTHVQSNYYATLKKENIPHGLPFGYIVSEDCVAKRKVEVAESIFLKLSQKSRATSYIPAGTYVVTYGYAKYGLTDEIYSSAFNYIEKHSLATCGKAYEEYQLSELARAHSERYLAKVMVQVTRKV